MKVKEAINQLKTFPLDMEIYTMKTKNGNEYFMPLPGRFEKIGLYDNQECEVADEFDPPSCEKTVVMLVTDDEK